MPNTFNIISTDNMFLGDGKVLVPTGIANTPLRNLGKIENAAIRFEASEIELKTKMPEFALKRYLMGEKAIITASSSEPLSAGNIDVFLGSTASAYAAWAGAVLQTAYTAGEQTLVITGDVSASIAVGDLLKIYESGVGTEFFVASKISVSTNTTVTMPLADTLVNSYTTAATVSRCASTKNGAGRYANLTGSTGVFVFEEFQPAASGNRKALVIVAHKMSLPSGVELNLSGGEWIESPFEIQLLADPTQANGALLGYFYVYTNTIS